MTLASFILVFNQMVLAVSALAALSVVVSVLRSRVRSTGALAICGFGFAAFGFTATFFLANYIPFVTHNNIPGVFIVLLAVASAYVPLLLVTRPWKLSHTVSLILGIAIAGSVLVPNMVFQATVLSDIGTPIFILGPLAKFFFAALVVYPLFACFAYTQRLRENLNRTARYVFTALFISQSIFAVYVILSNVILFLIHDYRFIPYIGLAILPIVLVTNAVLPYVRSMRCEG